MDGPIASAVMLPEQDLESPQPASPPAGHKRRQSSTSEQDVKRPRLNSIDANIHPDRLNSIDAKPSTNVTGRRERGRERRLFGAALGALSQNPATAAQKRRSDIEKRQRAQRELEEQESDQRKLEREVQRKAQRQEEQKQFEKDSIRIRHANLVDMAHFLWTETEPRLYYKPWETTNEEDERIRVQIAEAEDIIHRELEEQDILPYDNGERERERERHDSRNAAAEPDAEITSSTGKKRNIDLSQQPSANGVTDHSGPSPVDLDWKEDHAEDLANRAAGGEQASAREQSNTHPDHEALADDEANKDLLEDNGEEVVEAAEDTVIY